jgi:multiple sugar transport system permease protein
MKRRLSEDTVWSVVGYVFLIAMLAITLFPWFIAGITSLKTHDQIYVMPPTWLPTAPRLVNYIEIFQVMPFARAFLNSTIVAVGSALLALMAALPAGYALSRFEFPGRRVFLFIVLGSIMFSPVVVIVALFRIMTVYNLIDKYWSLILTNATFSLSFCIWLSTAYMRSVPVELDEAASIDGASRLQALRHVVLPVALPGIATVTIFAFIQAWNEFLLANTFMSTNLMKPLPVAIYNFVGYRGTEWQFMTGAVILGTIPAILLFFAVQRWIIGGLTLGAVKS